MLEDQIEMRAAKEQASPDVSLHGLQSDGIRSGLLYIVANHAACFANGLWTRDSDLAAEVGLAEVEHLFKLGIWNDACFSLAVEHLFHGDERTVIYLVTEAHKEPAPGRD